MTGVAGSGKTSETPPLMTSVAGQPGVTAGEREYAVIESSRQPAVRGVAISAARTKLTVMGIVLCMTGITVGGSAFK